jgi:hypothetical protein
MLDEEKGDRLQSVSVEAEQSQIRRAMIRQPIREEIPIYSLYLVDNNG